MNVPSIVKFRIVPRSFELSRTRALLAAAVPGVTLSSTPISAVVIVVESSVNEVSPVIVPVIARFPELVIAPQSIVPANVTFAPLKLAEVVVPDLIIRSFELFVNEPYVFDPSFNSTSPPSAFSIISFPELSVTVVPASSAVPSAVIVIFASCAALSVVIISNVPFVPTVRVAVSEEDPVIVITFPSRLISSTDRPVVMDTAPVESLIDKHDVLLFDFIFVTSILSALIVVAPRRVPEIVGFEIVLFDNVSVVDLPINVSVVDGSVNVKSLANDEEGVRVNLFVPLSESS